MAPRVQLCANRRSRHQFAIKEMIIPSLRPLLAPILVYFVITAVAGQAEGFAALGALLLA